MIVNAAAESHVEKSIEEGAREFVTTNVEGTQILLDAIRAHAGRALHPHLVERGVRHRRGDPMDEEHPLNPRSPYAATKAGADRLAYSYWTTYDLPIVIVRPFNNYGPRQHPEKVVPRFITQALARRAADDPRRRAREPRLALRRRRRGGDRGDHRAPTRRLAGEVLNVATGVDISVAEIADAVLDASASRARCKRTSTSGRARSTATSARPTSSSACSGWRARTTFADGPRAHRRVVPRE